MSLEKPDFGRIAQRYDALRPGDRNWHEVFELVVQSLGVSNGRVLDVGCGTGRLVGALDEHGFDVWGVEPSPAMREQARRRLGDRIADGQAEDLPFDDGHFCRVTMWRVVHLL